MLSSLRTIVGLPVLVVALALSGCGSTPDPAESPSAEPAPSEPSESAAPEPEPMALPDCDTIYSPALVAALTAEGRTNEGDISALGSGGWGTFDAGIETILSGMAQSVHCTWILPASSSGSTTSIAFLDGATRTSLAATLVGAGFTASTEPSGDLYTVAVEEEFFTYTEAHLLTAELWFASAYGFGDATTLTLDAAAELLP